MGKSSKGKGNYLLKEGISVLRRVRKTDNNRIARATGAVIVNRPEEITEEETLIKQMSDEVQNSQDYKEGQKAFEEKRKPSFKGN